MPRWTQGHNSVFASILEEQYGKVGPIYLEEWVENCIRKYDVTHVGLTPQAFDQFRPEAPRRPYDNTECKFCRDNKWFDPGNGRLIKCHCPPEARVKYEGYKTAPVNITQEIKKRKDAVNTEKPPEDIDKSLGFYLLERAGRWELYDFTLPNGFRTANTFEVIMWRAMQFWKRAFFGLKEQKDVTERQAV